MWKTFKQKIFAMLKPALNRVNYNQAVTLMPAGDVGLPPKVSGNVDRGTYNRMPQSRVVTNRLLPVIKPTQLVMGDFSNRYLDGDDAKKADDAIALIDPGSSCHLHFLKNLGHTTGWSPRLDGRLSRCTQYIR